MSVFPPNSDPGKDHYLYKVGDTYEVGSDVGNGLTIVYVVGCIEQPTLRTGALSGEANFQLDEVNVYVRNTGNGRVILMGRDGGVDLKDDTQVARVRDGEPTTHTNSM